MLPTIEQSQEFLRLVNVGREAAGLEPLDKLDFDRAEPGDCLNCLSARNLFSPAGYDVLSDSVFPIDDDVDTSAPEALGMKRQGNATYRIPDAITVVTDPFDREEPGLRERLSEAGVI